MIPIPTWFKKTHAIHVCYPVLQKSINLIIQGQTTKCAASRNTAVCLYEMFETYPARVKMLL